MIDFLIGTLFGVALVYLSMVHTRINVLKKENKTPAPNAENDEAELLPFGPAPRNSG